MKATVSKTLLAMAIIAFASCDNENETEPEANKPVHTYMAGSATLRDNGTRVRLLVKDTTKAIAAESSQILAITTNGSDVYAIGILNEKFVVWKNEVPTTFAESDEVYAITDIAVSGSTVYVIGNRKSAAGLSVATIWTNGVATNLSDNSSEAYDIEVQGNDVFVAGYVAETSGEYGLPVYWKNGVKNNLSDPGYHPDYACEGCIEGAYIGTAQAIAIDGADVYVLGSSYNEPGAVLWKNNVASFIGSTNAGVYPNCLAVENGNLHASIVDYENGEYVTKLYTNALAISIDANNPIGVKAIDGSVYSLVKKRVGVVKGKGNGNKYTVYKNGDELLAIEGEFSIESFAIGKD